MTNERAIVLLSHMYFPHFDKEEEEAITKGIKALARDTKKEVFVWDNGSEHCPACDFNITSRSVDDWYCCRCGQKIK